MKITKYDHATGRILFVADIPAEFVHLQDGAFLVGDADPGRQYVDVIEKKLTDFPARPSADHEWRWDTKEWAASLAHVRERRLKELKDQRDARVNGTFTWDGSVFDADPISQTRILGAAVSAAGAPQRFPVNWRTNNNAWRALSAADTSAVWDALQTHIQANFSAFATKEAQINALTTVEDLQTYDVTTGWPV